MRKPEWSQQLTFHFPYDSPGAFHIKHGIVQTYGKDLVRPDRDVGDVASHNIEQAVLLGIPEFCVEAAGGLLAKEAYNFLFARSWNAVAKPCMVRSALNQSA